jgi:hypothetical protein
MIELTPDEAERYGPMEDDAVSWEDAGAANLDLFYDGAPDMEKRRET